MRWERVADDAAAERHHRRCAPDHKSVTGPRDDRLVEHHACGPNFSARQRTTTRHDPCTDIARPKVKADTRARPKRRRIVEQRDIGAKKARLGPGGAAHERHPARERRVIHASERNCRTYPRLDAVDRRSMRFEPAYPRGERTRERTNGVVATERSAPYRAGDDRSRSLHREHTVDRHPKEIIAISHGGVLRTAADRAPERIEPGAPNDGRRDNRRG